MEGCSGSSFNAAIHTVLLGHRKGLASGTDHPRLPVDIVLPPLLLFFCLHMRTDDCIYGHHTLADVVRILVVDQILPDTPARVAGVRRDLPPVAAGILVDCFPDGCNHSYLGSQVVDAYGTVAVDSVLASHSGTAHRRFGRRFLAGNHRRPRPYEFAGGTQSRRAARTCPARHDIPNGLAHDAADDRYDLGIPRRSSLRLVYWPGHLLR